MAKAESPKQMSANEPAISTLLGRAAEFWDTGMLWSLGVAALAAVAVGVFTTGSVITNKRAARAAEAQLEQIREAATSAAKIADYVVALERGLIERAKMNPLTVGGRPPLPDRPPLPRKLNLPPRDQGQ